MVRKNSFGQSVQVLACMLLLGTSLHTAHAIQRESSKALNSRSFRALRQTYQVADRGGGDGGGGDGGGGGDDSASLGSGTVIAGTNSGCQVNQGSAMVNYDRCLQFSLRGTNVQLAYSVQQSTGSSPYVMNGAIVSSSSATNVWYAIGIPPSNSGRMIGTNAIVVQALTGVSFVIDFNLAGYTFSSFTPTTGFVNNATYNMKSVITGGNTLAGTFSIFLPSSSASQTVLLAYGPVVSGLMSRHTSTGRATLDTTVTSGQGTGPLLNQGTVTTPVMPSTPVTSSTPSTGISIGLPVASSPAVIPSPTTTASPSVPSAVPSPISSITISPVPSTEPVVVPASPTTALPIAVTPISTSSPDILSAVTASPAILNPISSTSSPTVPSPPSSANPATFNLALFIASFFVIAIVEIFLC